MSQVHITIRGEQNFEGETICTQSEAAGTMEKGENGWLLCYEEEESSGLGKTKSALEVRDERAVLTRSGGIRSTMIFVPGETHATVYKTQQGNIALEIVTKSLHTKLSERGGVLEIRYALSMNGVFCGENCLKMLVRI